MNSHPADHASQNEAAEIKIRAERRAGELLKGMEKAKGTLRRGDTMGPRDDTPTLAAIGIDKHESSRFQQAAATE